MEHEPVLQRRKLKGYLFEIIISELLSRNNFSRITPEIQPRERVRENRPGFIEIKGRGCWHQIDCPFEYNHAIPFSYPVRLLGEVKFYQSPLGKKHIREYIGVINDIQENYFVTDETNLEDNYPRKLDIGVYFSANGFQKEAEKLAYAHGIKTVSYDNNFLINRVKTLIEELEQKHLSVSCLKKGEWNNFRIEFINLIKGNFRNEYAYHHFHYHWRHDYMEVVSKLQHSLHSIKTSFIASTATGVFLHFVSKDDFPVELFVESDEGKCHVYYERDSNERLNFWLEIARDKNHSKFYFTPPKSLGRAALFGAREVLNEKEALFAKLNVNIQLNGITRSLILHIDTEWLDAARNSI